MKMGAIAVGLVLLVSVGVYFKIAVWTECRQDNSVFYCWQLLNK
jgi:hypothetical protein